MNFVLEGLPGAGKTTMLNQLSGLFSVVPEIINSDSLTADEQSYIRNDLTKQSLVKTSGITVTDRGFVSTLAYNYAHDLTHQSSRFANIRNIVSKLLNDGDLAHPTAYLFLDIPPRISLNRQSHTNETVWKNEIFLEHISSYYKDNITPLNNCHSINAQLAPDDVFNELLSIINTYRNGEGQFNG